MRGRSHGSQCTTTPPRRSFSRLRRSRNCSRRDGQMSVPHFRKVAAIALATGLGLGLAACSTKSDDETDAGGKTIITVDCQPVGAQKNLLQAWNDDVAAFEAANPDI